MINRTKILQLIEDALSQSPDGNPDDNPLAKYGLEDLKAGAGVNPKDRTAEEHEAARQRRILNDQRSRAKRREREERQRVERNETPTRPADLQTIYKNVIVHMLPVIIDTARAKAQRISRHLGPAPVEDVVSDTIERVAVAFARYDVETEDMVEVALDMRDRTSLPRDLDGLAKIMAQTINVQARKATSQWWRDNPTTESLDRLATMEYNSHGEDDLLHSAAAKSDLKIVGWRPAGPGAINHNYVAFAIHAIISMRNYDDIADIILGHDEDDEGNLIERMRTDGTFPWYRFAEMLWTACSLDDAVLASIPHDKRGKATQTAVRNRFRLAEQVASEMYRRLSEFDHTINDSLVLK